jgi:hypothetical protein
VPHIANNLASLLADHPQGFKVVDHTLGVFGAYYGQVRDRAVKLAVKDGTAPGSVDSLPVRLRPRWKDQHRAQAVPAGVPA